MLKQPLIPLSRYSVLLFSWHLFAMENFSRKIEDVYSSARLGIER